MTARICRIRRACVERVQNDGMPKPETFDHLRDVIASEIDAQLGVGRHPSDMAPLIADAVLDCFNVRLKPSAEAFE